MAAVIHSLWEKGDRNPLIMPANLPIDDPRVRDELTRYLPDQWKPIIEKDVDGPNALPLRIDGEVPNLGKFAGLPAGGADDLSRLGTDGDGGQSRHRGSADQARLRHAGRAAGSVRRRAAAAGGGGDLPLSGRRALLVLDPADRHQARRGPGRAAAGAIRTRSSHEIDRAAARRPAGDRRLPPHPSDAAVRRRRARRHGRPARGAGDRSSLQQGRRQQGAGWRRTPSCESRGNAPAPVPEHA